MVARMFGRLCGDESSMYCMAGGQTALALRVLLAVFSSKISSDINRPFGDEVVGLNSIQ